MALSVALAGGVVGGATGTVDLPLRISAGDGFVWAGDVVGAVGEEATGGVVGSTGVPGTSGEVACEDGSVAAGPEAAPGSGVRGCNDLFGSGAWAAGEFSAGRGGVFSTNGVGVFVM